MAGALIVLSLVVVTPSVPTYLVLSIAVAACIASLIGILRIHASDVAELKGSLRDGVVHLGADADGRLVENSSLSIPKDAVLSRIPNEVNKVRRTWDTSGPDVEFFCALRSLIHGRRTVASTLARLRSPKKAMRGTALEFFESILPPVMSRALLKQLGLLGPDST
jgi:hypothetical protein